MSTTAIESAAGKTDTKRGTKGTRKINLMSNESHQKEFCDAMNILFECREPAKCAKCKFAAGIKVQQMCRRRGITIRRAVRLWVESPLKNSVRWQMWADVLGVPESKVKDAMKALKQ